MSLINQMLRDLEQRQPASPGQSEPLNIAIPQTGSPQRRYWPVLLGLTGLLLASVWYTRDQATNPSQAPVPASPVTVTATPVQPEANPPAVAVAEPVIEIKATTPPPPPTEVAQPVPNARPALANKESASESPIQPAIAAPSPLASSARRKAPPSSATAAHSPRHAASAAHDKASASEKSRASSLFRQAQGSASLLMRKEILKELLDLDPQHLPARDLMLQTLLKSGSGPELERFLQDSLALFPQHLPFITTQAHQQIQRKEFAAASATLERADGSQSNEPTYLSLLAASYQQQKRYQSAVNVYQKLTQIQPDKAENWLGLGLCAENLQQYPTARQAYQQALEKNTLNSEVVDYINQRLRALN